MNTTKKIIATAIIATTIFSNTVLETIAASTGNYTFEQAVATSKQIDAMDVKIKWLVDKLVSNIDAYLKQIEGNTAAQKTILAKIKAKNDLLTSILVKVRSDKYKSNIYVGVYNKNLTNLQVKFQEYIKNLEYKTTPVINTSSTTTTTIKVWGTPEEKKIIAQDTVNYTKTDDFVNNDSVSQWDVAEQLKQNGWYTDLESKVLSMKNYQWDGFEFCANFTPDLYNNNGWRYYQDAQSVVADEYMTFINTYFPNWWKKGNKLLHTNIWRVQKCTAQLNGFYINNWVNQEFIKKLYEKAYKWKTFKVWEKPLYQDGSSTNDYEQHMINIDSYVKQHHGW